MGREDAGVFGAMVTRGAGNAPYEVGCSWGE